MRLPRPTKINQRVLGSAVVGLLAANAFAAAIIAGDAGGTFAAPLTPEASAAAPAATQTVTLITTADGRRLLVDPSTPAGQKAIADAQRQGGTTRDVAVPARNGSGSDSPLTLPGGLDLGSILDKLPSGGAVEVGQDVVDQLDKVGETVTSIVDQGKTTVSSIVDQGKTTVSSILDQGQTTVSSVVGGAQTTVSSVVGGAQSTVSSLVGSTPSTVTSVVGGVQSSVTSVLNQVPTTAPPATSLVGSLITTVSTVVQSVTPTTSAPTPTTVPAAPICGLLAHC